MRSTRPSARRTSARVEYSSSTWRRAAESAGGECFAHERVRSVEAEPGVAGARAESLTLPFEVGDGLGELELQLADLGDLYVASGSQVVDVGVVGHTLVPVVAGGGAAERAAALRQRDEVCPCLRDGREALQVRGVAQVEQREPLLQPRDLRRPRLDLLRRPPGVPALLLLRLECGPLAGHRTLTGGDRVLEPFELTVQFLGRRSCQLLQVRVVVGDHLINHGELPLDFRPRDRPLLDGDECAVVEAGEQQLEQADLRRPLGGIARHDRRILLDDRLLVNDQERGEIAEAEVLQLVVDVLA